MQQPAYVAAPAPAYPAVSPCGANYSVESHSGYDNGYGYNDYTYNYYDHGSTYGGGHIPHYQSGTVPPVGKPFGIGHGKSIFGHYGQGPSGRNRRGPLELYQPNSGYAYSSLGLAQFSDDNDIESLAVQGRIGYQTDTVFGIEMEGSLGVSSGDESITTGGATTVNTSKVKNSMAAYGTLRSPGLLTERIRGYGRLGYHRTEFEKSSTTGATTTETEEIIDGFAYGGGVEFSVTENDVVRFDYTRYNSESDDHSEALSLGYLRRF